MLTIMSSLNLRAAMIFAMSALRSCSRSDFRSALIRPSTAPTAPVRPALRFETFGPTWSFGNRASRTETGRISIVRTMCGARICTVKGVGRSFACGQKSVGRSIEVYSSLAVSVIIVMRLTTPRICPMRRLCLSESLIWDVCALTRHNFPAFWARSFSSTSGT